MKQKLLFSLITISSILFADGLDMEKLKAMKARSIGPGGMSGRVTAIDVVLSNTDIIYVGTASGGLWKSESGGVKWEPIFDNQKAASIGDVAVDPTNPLSTLTTLIAPEPIIGPAAVVPSPTPATFIYSSSTLRISPETTDPIPESPK